MQPFTQLKVWARAHGVLVRTYKETRSFPSDELYGMRSQLRRAVLSISANIAEGARRESGKDYARFLNIAQASASEAQALMIAAADLGYVEAGVSKELFEELEIIGKMLGGLRKSVLASKRAEGRSLD